MTIIRIFCSLLVIFITSTIQAENTPVIYGVSPYYFSRGHSSKFFLEIKKKLPEIKELGATILWLQPVFKSAEPGQGYDTVDFFRLNADFGTDEEFKALITEAHRLGLKIILDIALNHTSLQHPFAVDQIKLGPASTYYEFYQHETMPKIPYAQYFNLRQDGKSTFVYYFWDKLININYSSPASRNFVLDVLSHWIKNYDIDGYRFDAGWGPSSRWPQFYQTISHALRSLKKDVILIAEDKANYPAAYKTTKHPHLINSGFDFAYDWNSEDADWMSKWSFQNSDEEENTLFNSEDAVEAAQTFAAVLKISMKKASIPALRYIENNDTGSFQQHHTLKQTKWAAATMILLPGAPLLFYGQAEGINYSKWNLPAIDPQRSLRSYHPKLWDFYKKLLKTRQSFSSYKSITAVKVRNTIVEFIVDKKISVVVDFEKESVAAKKL